MKTVAPESETLSSQMGLSKGFAIIIDDQFGVEGDDINRIAQMLEDAGVPYCGFTSLDNAEKCLPNFSAVSFFILDWKMNEVLSGVSGGASMQRYNAERNIEFIKKLKNQCFAPVFIFSAEASSDIEQEVKEIDKDLLHEEEKRNFILIRGKSDLVKDGELFKTIQGWIQSNPSIYTLKQWDNSLQTAKNITLWHLFDQSPMWPQILWKTSETDGVDATASLVDTINKNVLSRMKYSSFDKTVISSYEGKITIEEIRNVIQGISFISKEYLGENDLQPGDIFKIKGDYYLNLRPICDTVISRMDKGFKANSNCDGFLYAIKGDKLREVEIKQRYNESLQMLNEQINEVIVYGIDGKDFFKFSLKKIYVHNFIEEKSKRIGRLLPPFISHVQQKYSSYVGRFGMPRIPSEIITELLPKDK